MSYPIFITVYPEQSVDKMIQRNYNDWLTANHYPLLYALSEFPTYIVYPDKTYQRLV